MIALYFLSSLLSLLLNLILNESTEQVVRSAVIASDRQ